MSCAVRVRGLWARRWACDGSIARFSDMARSAITGMGLIAVAVAAAVGGLPQHAGAATITAANCTLANVRDAVADASDGDVVVVPAGTCTWSSTLTITKSITLKGAGIDRTVIIDEVPRSRIDKSLIKLGTSAGERSRLTGFTLRRGVVNTQMNYSGTVIVYGSSKSWRLDHVKFSQLAATAIRVYGATYGVIDHNVFNLRGAQAIVVQHDTWGGSSFGDGSWADSAYLGSEKAVFIEDNVFNQSATIGEIDCIGGGRYVLRHNTMNNSMAGNHGTDSSHRLRSCRSMEIYENAFTKVSPKWYTGVFIRGGTGVIFGNTFIGYNAGITLRNYRSLQSFSPWGKCDGSSPYDGNTDDGYPCLDQPGRGRGARLSGSLPTPSDWPEQQAEPIYAWDNVLVAGLLPVIGSNTPDSVKSGRDFFQSPKPNYTPFQYPHPLVNGTSSTVLEAPSNLTVK